MQTVKNRKEMTRKNLTKKHSEYNTYEESRFRYLHKSRVSSNRKKTVIMKSEVTTEQLNVGFCFLLTND